MMLEKKEVLEQLLKKMIAEIQDCAIILMNIDGTILSWNKGAEMIKGYKEEEIIGHNFRRYLSVLYSLGMRSLSH